MIVNANSKNLLIGISAALLLTACSTNKDNVTPAYNHNAVAQNATKTEIQNEINYEKHVQNIKKHKKRFKIKKHKIDLNKFCFKDARSIHYRAEERCK